MPKGRTLVPGEARGPALVLSEPLSFWGGLDPVSGAIIDAHHPQRGAVVTGTVLVMPGGRGSSSSSSILAEAIRAGTAPAAIVLAEADPIIALGAIIARELYGASIPIIALQTNDLPTGIEVSVSAREDGAHLETRYSS
jgi:predicted aconitase with swiveling domain